MALTTNGAWQIRVEQPVAPDVDPSGATDVGQGEVETAVNAAEAVGYIGHAPSEGS